jgi:hypothetical protein
MTLPTVTYYWYRQQLLVNMPLSLRHMISPMLPFSVMMTFVLREGAEIVLIFNELMDSHGGAMTTFVQ